VEPLRPVVKPAHRGGPRVRLTRQADAAPAQQKHPPYPPDLPDLPYLPYLPALPYLPYLPRGRVPPTTSTMRHGRQRDLNDQFPVHRRFLYSGAAAWK
jgi:hypothetical protein